ncbi:hypothetical protein MGH68_04595 [Erysipelothrix sp. D19-032]
MIQRYREVLWEEMLELNREGTTVFLTTHYMEEPERFSDRIAIFSNGVIQAIGTSAELKQLTPVTKLSTLSLKRLSKHSKMR